MGTIPKKSHGNLGSTFVSYPTPKPMQRYFGKLAVAGPPSSSSKDWSAGLFHVDVLKNPLCCFQTDDLRHLPGIYCRHANVGSLLVPRNFHPASPLRGSSTYDSHVMPKTRNATLYKLTACLKRC